jgi:hypothetical protein
MRVDEAGEHVLAGGVDDGVGPRCDGPAAPERDGIERDDIGDGVVLDQDIFGSAGGCAVPIHHYGVMDQQAPIAPPVGGRLRGSRPSQ